MRKLLLAAVLAASLRGWADASASPESPLPSSVPAAVETVAIADGVLDTAAKPAPAVRIMRALDGMRRAEETAEDGSRPAGPTNLTWKAAVAAKDEPQALRDYTDRDFRRVMHLAHKRRIAVDLVLAAADPEKGKAAAEHLRSLVPAKSGVIRSLTVVPAPAAAKAAE